MRFVDIVGNFAKVFNNINKQKTVKQTYGEENEKINEIKRRNIGRYTG